MSLKQKAIKSFIWDYAGKFAGQIVSFTLGIILARLLTPEDYGLIGMVMAIVAIAQGITDIGLGSAIVQRQNITDDHMSTVFFMNMGLSLVLTMALFFAAPLVASFYDQPELLLISKVLSIYFLLNGTTLVQKAKFSKELRVHIVTQSNVISAILSGLIGVALAYNGFGVWALIVQTLLKAGIYSIIIWIRSKWRPSLIFKKTSLIELWSFGFNLFLSNMIYAFGSRLNVLVIGKMFSASVLGLFTRADSLNKFIIKYSSGSLSAISFPALSAIQDNSEKFKRNALLMINLAAFAAFGLCGVMYLIAEPLIIGLLTEKWRGAIPIFKILCLSVYVFPISAISLSTITAMGNSSIHLKLTLIKYSITITGMILGFYLGGLNGYLYSLIVTSTLNLLINFIGVEKVTKISLKDQLKNIYVFPLITIPLTIVLSQLAFGDIGNILLVIFLSILFGFLYLVINYLFKTESLLFLNEQVRLYKNRILVR